MPGWALVKVLAISLAQMLHKFFRQMASESIFCNKFKEITLGKSLLFTISIATLPPSSVILILAVMISAARWFLLETSMAGPVFPVSEWTW